MTIVVFTSLGYSENELRLTPIKLLAEYLAHSLSLIVLTPFTAIRSTVFMKCLLCAGHSVSCKDEIILESHFSTSKMVGS